MSAARDGRGRRAGTLVAVLAVLAVLGAAGCEDLLVSKETRQHIDAVKAAVRRNPGLVDAPGADGQPPLHAAVIDGYVSLQTWLLDRHANPNVRNSRGETAVFLAALSDHTPDRRVLRMLIRRGGDPSAARSDGATPLHVAAGYGTEPSVRALLEGGADPRRFDQRGDTPLHAAATPQPDRTAEDCRRIVAQLRERGADPDARNGFGIAPLHLAAMHGQVAVLEALLDAGAHVDLEGPDRVTALSQAAAFGQAPAVALLLARGADPDHRDGAGRTPLQAALERPAIRSTSSGSAPVGVDAVVALLRRPSAVR